MKKLLSLLLLASLFAVSCSKPLRGGADDIITQQKHVEGPDDNPHGGGGAAISVPAAVLSAFNSRYPDAKNTEWKQQSNGNYKAEFFRGAVKWEATFTKTGKLVKQEYD